jgi:hypothetical protein
MSSIQQLSRPLFLYDVIKRRASRMQLYAVLIFPLSSTEMEMTVFSTRELPLKWWIYFSEEA